MSALSEEPAASRGQAKVRLDRLRLGELAMLAASIALIVDMTAFPWYSLQRVYAGGLSGLGHGGGNYSPGSVFHLLTPLAIICVMLTWVICAFTVAQRAPAIPLCLTVVATVLEVVLSVGLLIRVVFDQPQIRNLGTGGNEIKPDVASIFGLFFAIALTAGAWLTLRTDGLVHADEPRRIETLRLAQRAS